MFSTFTIYHVIFFFFFFFLLFLIFFLYYSYYSTYLIIYKVRIILPVFLYNFIRNQLIIIFFTFIHRFIPNVFIDDEVIGIRDFPVLRDNNIIVIRIVFYADCIDHR